MATKSLALIAIEEHHMSLKKRGLCKDVAAAERIAFDKPGRLQF